MVDADFLKERVAFYVWRGIVIPFAEIALVAVGDNRACAIYAYYVL